MSTRIDEITEYAEAVRAALADVPHDDRVELLEDLEDHLAEVAVESGEPLVMRLGTPEEYAAELRAAYGAVSGRRSTRRVVTGAFDTAEGWLRAKASHPGGTYVVWSYVRELRPVWWVARAYVAAAFAWSLLDGERHLLPTADAQDTALLLFFTALSVVLGVRARDKGLRGTMRSGLVVANGAAAFGLAALVLQVGAPGGDTAFADAPPVIRQFPTPSLEGVVNIYPRSKDGKPLKDVLLYDQNGLPIELNFGDRGYELESCDPLPPITNKYPLRLRKAGGGPVTAENAPPACPEP